MLVTVISGGQTGADVAGWRAAKACGLACCGMMPRGFLTEDGPRPEYGAMYGAVEHSSDRYPPRTKANADLAEATLVLTGGHVGPGTKLTIDEARRLGRPCLVVSRDTPDAARLIADWLAEIEVESLNVAESRESSSPGIGAWAEGVLREAFGLVRDRESQGCGLG